MIEGQIKRPLAIEDSRHSYPFLFLVDRPPSVGSHLPPIPRSRGPFVGICSRDISAELARGLMP